jgi:nucleotide-binding universal stress UspA family protein
MNESIAVRRLLVPTDFSDHATAAVRYAAPLAPQFGAEVVLVHATAQRPPFDPLPGSGDVFILTYEENDRLARAALDQARSSHLDGVDVRPRMAFGEPAEAILEAAHASAADMIVMGTRGRGGLARAVLGSVAEAVIRQSDLPVLTVRRDSANDASRITRILCPINYSDAAAKAFRHALLFASAFEAELIALYFQEDGSTEDDLEAEVERLRVWVGDVPLSVHLTCLAHRGDPATQVNEYARTRDVDLVVIGAQRRRGGVQTTIGSTTDGLTRHAPCPVLTVPADAILIAERPREDAALKRGA